EVAMHEAGRVRGAHSPANVPDQRQRPRQREGPVFEQLAERLPLESLHHQIGRAFRTDAGLEDPNDAVAPQPSESVKWTYLHAIDVRHSLELAHELDEVSTALARPQALVDVVDWRGSCLLELGRGDAFVAETQRCERAAERYRYPNLGWQARRMQAACAFLRGALDESTEQAHAAS